MAPHNWQMSPIHSSMAAVSCGALNFLILSPLSPVRRFPPHASLRSYVPAASIRLAIDPPASCLEAPSSVTIPRCVPEIGEKAVYRCSLRILNFEEGTVRIGECAFSNCAKLRIAYFPASLAIIESEAFSNC
jgi:hypothetical protein